jgi:hypothetical protein
MTQVMKVSTNLASLNYYKLPAMYPFYAENTINYKNGKRNFFSNAKV